MAIIAAGSTDLIYSGGVPFFWDDTRAKWLSLDVESFGFAYSGSLTNGFMKFSPEAFASSATLGYLRAYDMVCIGGGVQVAVSSSCTFRILDDGASAAAIALSSATSGTSDTLNSGTIASGSIIAGYVTGTASTACHATFYCRRVLA